MMQTKLAARADFDLLRLTGSKITGLLNPTQVRVQAYRADRMELRNKAANLFCRCASLCL